jgi:triosephosphate isomerase
LRTSSELTTPIIVVNFKTYPQVEGAGASALARACSEVAEEAGVTIAVSPPMVELSALAREAKVPVFAQHVDPRVPGSTTGWVTPSMVSATGAVGTLLNHSEHRMVLSDIREAVGMCRELDLRTIVCTDSAPSSGAVAFFRPDYIAVEPPELIGGDISVTTADPGIVSDSVEAVRSVADIPVLCGAGVKTGEDVRAALELGAKGVLLASGVVKAKDPKQALLELVSRI